MIDVKKIIWCNFQQCLLQDLWEFSYKQLLLYHRKKIKFSIKGFSSTCDQIHILLRFWSHLLQKFLMENFIFCIVYVLTGVVYYLNWDFWKTVIPTLLSCFFIPWKKYISLGILKITNSFVQKRQTCKNLIYSQASFIRLHF